MIAGWVVLALCAAAGALVVWNALAWPRIRPGGGEGPAGSVSVLIPARNEATRLPAALAGALAQGAVVGEVLVYDDHSTDATAEVIDRAARADPRVRRIAPTALPEGWYGKPFACHRLAGEARGEWLLFLDADATLAAGALAGMLAEARRRDAGFLSAWPALTLGGFWEGALLPMLNFVVFTLYPAPLSLVRSDAALGLAHGACILARASTYRRIGGHGAVRSELFEDTALARHWRREGNRGVCLDGQSVVGVRMYDSFGGIWSGFLKNFYPAFRREGSFWAFLLFHILLLAGPVCGLAASGAGLAAAWPFATAAGLVVLMRAVLLVRFRQPLWSLLLHPLAATLLIVLGLASWWRCRFGPGVEWKGRRYRPVKP